MFNQAKVRTVDRPPGLPIPGRHTRRAVAWATIAFSMFSTGCRNRAYSDLYVESMAAEIRQLEDQLYEYDNEYHISNRNSRPFAQRTKNSD